MDTEPGALAAPDAVWLSPAEVAHRLDGSRSLVYRLVPGHVRRGHASIAIGQRRIAGDDRYLRETGNSSRRARGRDIVFIQLHQVRPHISATGMVLQRSAQVAALPGAHH